MKFFAALVLIIALVLLAGGGMLGVIGYALSHEWPSWLFLIAELCFLALWVALSGLLFTWWEKRTTVYHQRKLT